jgi:ribosomal protein S18 acetylase RimI-like enzyme
VEIIIRPARARDYDDLCNLIDTADALHHRHLPHIFRKPRSPARDVAYIVGLISDPDTALFVAEVEGQLAGFVTVLVRDASPIPVLVPRRLAIVDNLAVRRDLRRHGIGRALMHKAQRWASARGATAVELNVYEFNEAAIAFYEALGYEKFSRRMSTPLRPEEDRGTNDD